MNFHRILSPNFIFYKKNKIREQENKKEINEYKILYLKANNTNQVILFLIKAQLFYKKKNKIIKFKKKYFNYIEIYT